MFKTRIFILLVLPMTLWGQNSLKLASDVWPPFTDIKENKKVALDIVEKALNRIEQTAEINVMEFEDVIKGIENKSFDGSAALWKTEEREQILYYSSPYLHNQLVLVGLKGTNTDITFKDLEGKRLGLVKGYAYGNDILKNEKIEKEISHKDQENLEKLFNNKIDFFLVDALEIEYLLKYQLNDVHEYLSISQEPLIVQPLYFAVRKDYPEVEKLMVAFNQEILEMIKDGTYHEILDLNWVMADVDGDGNLELHLAGESAGTEKPGNAYALHHDVSQLNGVPNEYYIDGKSYKTWESVPSKYKKKIRLESSQTENNGGLTLSF